MSDQPHSPGETARQGLVRAFYDWLVRSLRTSPLAAPDADGPTTAEALPSRIGHYAITHKLGQGGMGVVYAARDERLQRPVALKMISSQSYDETTRKRFWREARTAASVNHPNICQIYDIGDDDGDDLFIAMELLEGEPLDRRLQEGPMSVSQAVPVALDILAALAALHARGVVHRDLKPSNVFLTPHGVKVLDFGVAQAPAGTGAHRRGESHGHRRPGRHSAATLRPSACSARRPTPVAICSPWAPSFSRSSRAGPRSEAAPSRRFFAPPCTNSPRPSPALRPWPRSIA